MSIVRRVAALAIAATASLAAASAQAAAPRPAQTHAASPAETAKRAACEKVWADQKVRHGTRQAFVAACVAKG